jgi:hypothetical protein
MNNCLVQVFAGKDESTTAGNTRSVSHGISALPRTREFFFFGESGFVLIDSESIAEIIRQ